MVIFRRRNEQHHQIVDAPVVETLPERRLKS